MATYTILAGQSIMDVALINYGTVAAAMGIAEANDVALTAELAEGTVLELPEGLETDKVVTNYYVEQGVYPATA